VDSPYDEHPVADVTLGQNKVWQAVDAIVKAGHRTTRRSCSPGTTGAASTTTRSPPHVEHTPDGVQLGYGPRVPLLMFGGKVRPGIDCPWNSHLSIGRTVLDLLAPPPLGVPASTRRAAWPT
jgi:hypothetical protein